MSYPDDFDISRVNQHHPGFQKLVQLLDAELAIRDGDDHAFFAQFNKSDHLNQVIVILAQNEPVACGALKKYDDSRAEIKRMYTKESHRKRGLASTILQELETWARELGYQECILETGLNQPEAIALYEKIGYQRMEPYAPYEESELSVCFRKEI